eukprot:TRINITY_DN9531_c0_g1_i1.p1 TRINITY_DN9531_c0_g1~~TRINITY_DN9531_c0_g1_i1.p1  ORF type:complete len:368 (-),score=153.74 TRINITY_DN9531_c0_g1_i1:134-1237(-)
MSVIEKGEELFLFQFPLTISSYNECLVSFNEIMKDSSDSTFNSSLSKEIEEKKEWWKQRRDYDEKLRVLLEKFEREVLSFSKIFLFSPLLSHSENNKERISKVLKIFEKQKIVKDVEKLDEKQKKIISSFSQSLSLLQQKEISSFLEWFSGKKSVNFEKVSSELFRLSQTSSFKKESKESKHIALILDDSFQFLPFENIPFLREKSVSRIPSFQFFFSNLQKKKEMPKKEPYFILNPGKDLMNSEKRLSPYFEEKLKWEGIKSTEPSSSLFLQILKERELFVYCGHGSGEYFVGKENIRQLDSAPALSILMGCGSGKLKKEGEIDPYGIALSYMTSGCPSLVGNLWDVTDCDSDRFTIELISLWKNI